MPLTRTQHWDTREFHEYLLSTRDRPFTWGTHDCCTAAANAIESFTGVDLADAFRGKYHDETSAFALIHSITGGTTVADAAAYCASRHGLVERPHPLFAQRGDLVVIDNGDTMIAGVIHLNGRHVVSVSERGLVRLPVSKIIRSWAV